MVIFFDFKLLQKESFQTRCLYFWANWDAPFGKFRICAGFKKPQLNCHLQMLSIWKRVKFCCLVKG